ncbi:hypothetical protein AAG747_07835 [Rapidithrix thailandica]|uniref:Response regulatory domain-containing protein n=1 Tax=Rapidithrix thailandica TaxID=413964 RepID=A0AAW9RSR6_9BACT
MKELKLLIVEDDPEQKKSYERSINAYNLDSNVKINPTFEADKESALKSLENVESSFDAAIVDLKLDENGKADQNYSGNEVLKKIKGNLRFPVFVITGTPQHIDDDLKEESSLFKIRTRGEDDNYLEQLVNIYNTGVTNILGKKGEIEKYLNDIFWKHLSNSVDVWVNDTSRNPLQKEKSLLRYTLLHIQEYLELTEEYNFESYHPAETYITPPVKPNIFTGDIVKENSSNKKFIVLTPSCDLAQQKAKDILLVLIEENTQGIISEKKNIIKKNKARPEVINEAKNTLEKLLQNSYSNKYHFLPKYNSIEGGLINFQKVKSIKRGDFESDFSRIASLNSQFTKDVVARFSYYYSRQGSPDFKTEELKNMLF